MATELRVIPGESLEEICQKRVAVESLSSQDDTEDSQFVLDCLYDNEVGDARLFRHLNDKFFIFDHSAARWYAWRDHYWAEDIIQESHSNALDKVVDAYATEANRQACWATNATRNGDKEAAAKYEKNRFELLKRVNLLQTVFRRKNVLLQAAAGNGLRGEEWDRLPMVLACQNGVIDLKTGRCRPGRQEDYIKTVSPTEWAGIDTPCPTWDRFLIDTFSGDTVLISFVQRLFGYSLTGTCERHILPIFYGEGRNGKSTLLETLKSVLGDYAYKTESELLLEQRQARQAGTPNSAAIALRSKRLVFASETGDGRKLNASRVKELVGGDTLNARGVFAKHQVEFKPQYLLCLMTNHKPHAASDDYALWQRIALIDFNVAFVEEPKWPNEKKSDQKLSVKLAREAAGILAWLVRGCLDYQENGLKPPKTVKAATEEYQKDEDVIGQFINECCVQASDAKVQSKQAFTAYQEWSHENGINPINNTRFGKEIKKRFGWIGPPDAQRVFYIGFGLMSEG